MGIFDNLFKKENLEKEPWLNYYTKEEKNLTITDKTIYEFLISSVGLDTHLTAINYFGKSITFGQLFSKVELVSKGLHLYGVRASDVVTICMPNTPEAIFSFYACNKIGAIANMVHPLSAAEEIKKYLLESKTRVLIIVDIVYEKIKDIINDTLVSKIIVVSVKDSMPPITAIGYVITRGLKVKKPDYDNGIYLKWSEFLARASSYKEEIKNEMTSDDVALILHSGGTTGKPKGILLTNSNVNALTQQISISVKRVMPKDKVVTILPIFHGFGLAVCINAPLCLKMEVILEPEFNAKRFTEIVKKQKPNFLAGVPTLWESMLTNKDFEDVDLSNLKYVISGGDFLTESLESKINKFLRKHGASISICKGYGMTEAVAATAFTTDGANKPGSVGIPMPLNKFAICTPNTSEELPIGEEGEICICGPTVMKGYLDNEKETNMVLQIHKDGNIWLHTGDLGYISPEGIVYFTQRLKRMIISSGYNVYPSRIEEVIERHPKVLKCSVVGIPHPYKMQVAKAYIVLKSNEKPTAKIKKEIKELCEQNLAKYSCPKEYEFRESLPKTLLGKVDVNKLD